MTAHGGAHGGARISAKKTQRWPFLKDRGGRAQDTCLCTKSLLACVRTPQHTQTRAHTHTIAHIPPGDSAASSAGPSWLPPPAAPGRPLWPAHTRPAGCVHPAAGQHLGQGHRTVWPLLQQPAPRAAPVPAAPPAQAAGGQPAQVQVYKAMWVMRAYIRGGVYKHAKRLCECEKELDCTRLGPPPLACTQK